MTINLEKSLDIDAPIADIFAVWLDLSSASRLLPHGEHAQVELTEQLENQQLSWKITGPEVVGMATVQLAPTGEHHFQTQVTLTAHYPNGLGPNTTVSEVTASMENGLANVARLLRGEAFADKDKSKAAQAGESIYPDVTESAATLYQTMTTATEAWVASVNKGFQLLSTFAWLPWQTGLAKHASASEAP